MSHRLWIRISFTIALGTIPPLASMATLGAEPLHRGAIAVPSSHSNAPAPPIPDWTQDALVIASPAAAVGGPHAGIYPPSVNGVRPYGKALIRWLTGRHVMGNTAVLVRQEGPEGAAGLDAVVDRNTDYVFQASVFLSTGKMFGDRQEELSLRIAVLAGEQLLAEAPVQPLAGQWTPCKLTFSSGKHTVVRCLVRAHAPRRLPCFYYADEFRLTPKDDGWWRPQNLFDDPRTALRLPDRRDELIRSLDPDVVGGHNGLYLNWDGFFTRRGIAVGGGQWEQEYNHVATDDPAAAQFVDNGIVQELDGRQVAKQGLWPGYHMCHNAPLWHSYQQKRMIRIAPEVQVISQDNICAPSFEQAGRGCFCRWCRDGFRDWLRARWSAEQFHAAGIADPKDFDIAAYVRGVGQKPIARGRDAVLADPVLRGFIQYHYKSQLDCWRDNVVAAKRAAGHPLVVCGNQWGGGGQRPFSVALSQISDVAVVETGGGPLTRQSRAWDALASKLSLAAGEYRRPVWLYMTSLFHAAEAARSRLRLTTAQAWADGGIPSPWATAPVASGWFYDTEAHFSRFVQRHRAVFSRRDRYANVGLVYSLPTHAWRQFRAFNLSPATYRQWFVACAQLLEEAHVPYEVNCWWHPLLGDDRASLERLNRYKVLVLPGVDCYTEEQREAVRAFQARGGRVLTIGGTKSYDADGLARSDGQPLALPGDRTIELDGRLLAAYAKEGSSASASTTSMAVPRQLRAALEQALGGDALLRTTAPADVWANLWTDETRKILALHLANGKIETAADRFQPVCDTTWTVRLPASLAVDRAVAISPDAPDPQGEAVVLPVKIKDGWATVAVPRIESYVIIALTSGNPLVEAKKAAEARRARLRAEFAR